MTDSAIDQLFDYPFRRLNVLLEGVEPGDRPVNLHLGEPQLAPPAVLAETVAAHAAGWSKYPAPRGTPAYNAAAADWLTMRYGLPAGMLDPARHVIPCAGTREALFHAALVAASLKRAELPPGTRPAVAMPNPLYHVYYGAALMADAEPVLLPAGPETGYLPDFAALDAETLDRLAIAYLCSPSNPTGAVASTERLARDIALARRHGFVLAADECYSEIYRDIPPPGVLEACAALGGSLDRVLVFNSLSKRSSAPGLRCGLAAGEPGLIDRMAMLRGYGGAPPPEPLLAAGAALWADENHVAANRVHYARLLDIADEVFSDWPGFALPEAGFFLWLPVPDGEDTARRLWRDAGVKVMPGRYMSRPDPATDASPGDGFVRIALVYDEATMREALGRIAGATAPADARRAAKMTVEPMASDR